MTTKETDAVLPAPSYRFRLCRIIMVNSYSRGAIVQIDLTGHTTITGFNGAGKTTLLQSIPLFYGEAPRQLVQSDAVKDAFGKYWFHSTGSYLIFEYCRDGRTVMSVLHADGQTDTIAYRFVDSPFRLDLFTTDAAGLQVVQTGDIYRHIMEMGVLTTRAMSREMYRSIIQNTPDKDKERRQWATRFAFCGLGSQLRHVDRVVTAILQRATSFADLKRMIVTTSTDGREGAIVLQAAKGEVLSWVNEVQAHLLIANEQGTYDRMVAAELRRQAAFKQLRHLRRKVDLLHADAGIQIESLDAALLDLMAKADAEQLRHGTEQEAIQGRLSAAHGQFLVLDGRVKNLDAEKRQYDLPAFVEARALSDQEQAIRSDLKQAQLTQSILLGKHEQIHRSFETMKQDAKSDYARDERVLNGQQLECKRHWLEETQPAIRLNHDAQKELLKADHAAECEPAITTVADLKTELALARQAFASVGADPDLLAEQKEATATINRLQTELANELKVAHKAEEEKRQSDAEYGRAEKRLNEASLAQQTANAALEDADAMFESTDATLLAFLRQNKPDWAGTIGKLIPTALLDRRDLSPSLGDGQDFYGIQIDLNVLPGSYLADEASYQQYRSQLLAACEASREEVRTAQAQLASANEVRSGAKMAAVIAASTVSSVESDLQEAKRQLGQIETAILNSATANQLAAKERILKIQERQIVADGHLKRLRDQHAKALLSLENQQQTEMAKAQERCNEQVQAIVKQQGALQAAHERNLKELDGQCASALSEAGLDPTILDDIGGKILALDGKLTAIAEWAPKVAAYRQWVRHAWPTRSQLQTERDDAEADQAREAMALQDEDRRHTAAKQSLEKQLDSNKRSRNTLEKTRGQIETLQRQQLLDIAAEDGSGIGLAAGDSFAALCDGVSTWVVEHRNAQTEVQQLGQSILRAMSRHDGTRVYQFYATIKTELDRDLHNANDVNNWLNPLKSWFERAQDSNKASIVDIGTTQALKFRAFKQELKDFELGVSRIVNSLKASLSTSNGFAHIQGVTINASANLEDLPYMRALEAFTAAYETWHAGGVSALPDPSFIEAAQSMSLYLGESSGLSAHPAQLISLSIEATISGRLIRAYNEDELNHLSSNGLSFVVLCIVMIGFINRIRRTQDIMIHWPIDELADLDRDNVETLLDLLSHHGVTLVTAFPDYNPDFAELCKNNYRILPGRLIQEASISSLDEEDEPEAAVPV